MAVLGERVTRKIVYEKASPRVHRRAQPLDARHDVIRSGRETLRELMPKLGADGGATRQSGGRICTIADLAWRRSSRRWIILARRRWDATPAMKEWYVRMKSRPSFRSLLADRVPGQPPWRNMPNSTSDIRNAVRERALAESFDVVRFARAKRPKMRRSASAPFSTGPPRHDGLAEKNAERRADPAVLWPDAKSVVVVGANYGPDHDPLEGPRKPRGGRDLGLCPRRRNYHDVLKKR